MKTKACILAIICLFSTCIMQAVEMRYRLSPTAGFIMKDGKVDGMLTGRPVLGGKFAVEFLPTGKWKSLQELNNASFGIALDYFNLGNDDMMGQAFAPYIYLNIPLLRLPHFELGLRPGLGAAFVTKTYYNTIPDGHMYLDLVNSNRCVGSYTNAYFAEALYFDFPIKNGWRITASYAWHHLSNGSTKQPNSGYNMFIGEIGASYQPGFDRYHAPATRVPRGLYEGKRWDVEISASGGFRQAYYRDQITVGTGSFQIAAHWRPWSIFKIGGGIDLFYDGYYNKLQNVDKSADNYSHFMKTYLATQDVKNCFRLGISLQPEFVFGNFSAGFHFGVYVFNPIGELEPYGFAEARVADPSIKKHGLFYSYSYTDESGKRYSILDAGTHMDGWLYTRILFKYRCTQHLFVQLGLKAHLTKAEFIDAGLGIAL